ncbi:RND transporter [Aeoliella sp.]|uniref:RND transporter n=1 Tax=Aeoliella sp. TaxID=2795800 RepID=UPI003CCBE9F6
MMFQAWTRLMIVPVMACGLLLTAGCSQETGEANPVASEEAEGHNLHGFWCSEHGVPEDICAQCDTRLAAEYQAKGDWCEEHSRPDSQCFICHPELADKFAAQYEAKFGEKPPEPSAEHGDHDGHEHDDHDHES